LLEVAVKESTVRKGSDAAARNDYVDAIGAEVMRFQDASATFDDLAAEILAVERCDLPLMTMLLYGGAAPADVLPATLQQPRSAVVVTLDRLELAGYARRRMIGQQMHIELTDHARQWIHRLWEPLREEGGALLQTYSTRELAAMTAFMSRATAIQERHIRRLRRWLTMPSTRARRAHLRGGLPPAAVQRIRVFVEGNLERPIRLADLAARAVLSRYHFARAFRVATGMTPRRFVEERRVERARQLIAESDSPLADIALQSGFGTQSRLSAAFKKGTGFTPAAYRRGRRRP
jgi:AraC family transcriptional regulator